VFGVTGYLHALDGNHLQQRMKKGYDSVAVDPAAYRDNIPYLSDVLSGKLDPGNDLSSLPNNLIVVRILAAASQSAKEGRRIVL
jgi:hypothetical protein